MTKRPIYTSVLAVMFIFITFSLTAFAQEFRGTINGTVKDQNSAVIPAATVTIQNTATNVSSNVTTNDDGAFSFPLLIPGKYKITATASNFQTSVRDNVELSVDDKLTVDFELTIGSQTQVNVVADDELIERGSVTVGTLVTTRQIEELPLAEGAPYTLATQAPGVVYTGDPNFQGPTANGNLAGFRSNGAAGNQINLDGSPNLAYSGQVAFTPPSDAVQEFKIQTNDFDAQNGFTAGSTVNVAIKSGTNNLHGTAYLFDRAKNRTANNFFNNRAGRERPGRQYNRYGFVLNGPVYVPFLYKGQDKTFFLFSYERQKDNVAQPQTYSVPTALMRTGNFSELGTANPIYDPASAYMGNSTCGTTGTLNTVCRTAFAGNIIPANRIYAPALNFLKLFPAPNLPGITNNYITDQNLIRPYRSYLARVDHNFNGNNRIFGKYYHSRNTEDRYNLTGEPDSITRGFENRRNNGGNVDFTSTLTSNLILDVRGSYNKFELLRYQQDQPTAAELGFTGIPSSRSGDIFPRFDFRNYLTLGSLRSDYNGGQDRPFNLFSFQPTITQIYGKNTLKYGYDFRRLNEKFNSNLYSTGRFTIDGTYTAQASNSNATQRNLAGRDIAAFLLGVPASGFIDNPTEYNAKSKYNAFFVQDDLRVSQKLTLNLGLRYELEGGVTESQGRIVTDFNRTIASPIAASALANYNASVTAGTLTGVPVGAFQNLSGGLTFANDGKTPNQKADKNNFQPRIGVSYSLDDKTVVRGGFGIFTSPFQIQTIFQPGFSTPTTYTPSVNNGLTFNATLSNPFPTGIVQSPGSAQGLLTFTGRDVTTSNATGPTTTVLSNDRKNANYTRFVIGIQRELPFKIGVEATYVYSKGSDLAVSRELNAIPAQYLNNFAVGTDPTTITTAIANVNTSLNALVGNPLRGLIPDGGAFNSATIARRRLLTPFPQYGNIAVTEYNGSSSYQSFQLQIVKRFTKGLSLNASYTHTKEHQKAQYLNPQDTDLIDIISPNERPNRYTASAIYEIPFGRGRGYFNNLNRYVDIFLGGFQVQGVFERQDGEPLLFPNVYFNGDPNQLESKLGKKDEQGRRYGVDIPAFDITGFYINGVAPAYANNYTSNSTNTLRSFPLTVDSLRNQRFLKFDLGLSKNFRIREGMKFQIRIEAINLLNSPYFTAPTLDPTVLPTAGNNLGSFGFTAAPTRQPPRDIQIGGRFSF